MAAALQIVTKNFFVERDAPNVWDCPISQSEQGYPTPAGLSIKRAARVA